MYGYGSDDLNAAIAEQTRANQPSNVANINAASAADAARQQIAQQQLQNMISQQVAQINAQNALQVSAQNNASAQNIAGQNNASNNVMAGIAQQNFGRNNQLLQAILGISGGGQLGGAGGFSRSGGAAMGARPTLPGIVGRDMSGQPMTAANWALNQQWADSTNAQSQVAAAQQAWDQQNAGFQQSQQGGASGGANPFGDLSGLFGMGGDSGPDPVAIAQQNRGSSFDPLAVARANGGQLIGDIAGGIQSQFGTSGVNPLSVAQGIGGQGMDMNALLGLARQNGGNWDSVNSQIGGIGDSINQLAQNSQGMFNPMPDDLFQQQQNQILGNSSAALSAQLESAMSGAGGAGMNANSPVARALQGRFAAASNASTQDALTNAMLNKYQQDFARQQAQAGLNTQIGGLQLNYGNLLAGNQQAQGQFGLGLGQLGQSIAGQNQQFGLGLGQLGQQGINQNQNFGLGLGNMRLGQQTANQNFGIGLGQLGNTQQANQNSLALGLGNLGLGTLQNNTTRRGQNLGLIGQLTA